MSKKINILELLSILIIFICSICFLAYNGKSKNVSTANETERPTITLTSSENTETINIVKDGASDYTIIFSASDALQLDADFANDLSKTIRNTYGLNIRYKADSTAEVEKEILLGTTNRAFSKELASIISNMGTSSDIIFIIAEKDGKLALEASNKIAFDKGKEVFLSLLGESDFTVEKGLYIEYFQSKSDYDKELADNEEAAEAAKIAELKDKIANDFDSKLGGTRTEMPSGLYQKPLTYPTEDQHPRLNLTADMLPEIRTLLENPEYKDLANKFWEDANSDEDGILPDVSTLGKTYNWDGKVLARIEAKALAYLLTGKEIYAYEAIYAMKNHMTTLTLSHDLFTDLLRPYGWSMMVAGEVYDWCYDLMTDEDKAQFVYGVQKFYCEDCPCGETDKLTIGFPPTGGGSIQGHGTNVSLLRDYIAFSIAIYDECPDWWELVGGRFYEEYVPANNVFYAAGMNTQGTSCYIYSKLYAQIYSAWLIKTMSGEMPYDSGIEDVVYGLMGLRLPNGKVFSSGDGSALASGQSDDLKSAIYIAQALFPSEIMQRNARILTNDYCSFSYGGVSNYISPTTSLIFRANGYKGEVEGEKTDDLKLVWYYGSPMGQMTVRNDWSTDAAAVFMRIGELTASNHDHEDAGTFQIYYKGCFTSESGQYGAGAGYGTTHHSYWHQATIAHNGLLVYNPNLASSCEGYYSGGQNSHSAPSNDVYTWLNTDTSKTGTVTGYDYYSNTTGEVEYAYLAGDISIAYPSAAVDTIERRMLTVYTGDEDFQMFFFVYDYIKSKDASYQKSFLLHTFTEPEIDGNVVTYVQNEGKMVLTTLTDDAVITKIGGEGKTYWINDTIGNLNKDEAGSGTAAGSSGNEFISDGALWGRVQINNVGKLEDHLLNVIYVTDAANENTKTPVKLENNTVIGAQLDDYIIAYNKTESKNRAVMEFTTEGSGLKKYYVSGMSAGTWHISVDGITVAHAHTKDTSGLISFTAPAGKVTLEPGNDIRPANSDDIKYTLNGGILPDEAMSFYIHDVEYVLPELASTETMTFAGWYTDEFSTERIYTIPVGTRGTFKAYAKFYRTYIEDYEKTKLNVIEGNKSVGEFIYQSKSKQNASFMTVTADDGNTYLLWNCGTEDPQFYIKTSMSGFLAVKNIITFKLDVALDGDNPPIMSTFRLRGKTSAYCSTVFSVTADGAIRLGGSATHTVTSLTKEFQTLIFSVDFEKGLIYALDAEGNLLSSKEIALPTKFLSDNPDATPMDYKDSLIFLYDWYTGTQGEDGHALRIDNIKVTSGLPENANLPDTDAPNAIIYNNLSGGTLPYDAKYVYNANEATPLPDTVYSSSGLEFLGWYEDENFTRPLTSVPAGLTEQFNVWARWRVITVKDFEGSAVDLYCPDSSTTVSRSTVDGIYYNVSQKAGATFKTQKSIDGNSYLVWSVGTQDPQLQISGCLKEFIGIEKSVTYQVKVALEDGKAPINSVFRVQETGSKSIPVFTTTADGYIILGSDNSKKIAKLTDEFVTITVTVDFLNGTITAYTEDGVIAENLDTGEPLTAKISKPSASKATDLVDYISYTQYAFVWYDLSAADAPDSSLRIDDLTIISGDFIIGRTDSE